MNRIKNRSIGLFFGVLLGVILSAVAVSGEMSFEIENETTIIDQAGRKVDVPFPFHRIISLYGAHTENLFSLDGGAGVIGVSRNEAYPPEALTRPVFSYRDDPEKFMAVRPDLVLIRPMIDRGYPKFVKRLEKSGIVVVSLQPATIEEMYLYWRILGVLTGHGARAEEMVRRFKETVSGIRSITEKLSARKNVYFEAIHSKMKTFAPESMAIFALETAGGINVASDAKSLRKTNIAAYGKERILSHSRSIDVYLAQYGAMNRPSVSLIKNEPGFDIIGAVKDNQIFIIDEMIVSRPTMRLLEGVYTIGSMLYPDIFTEKLRTGLHIPGK
jgi:ABC-type Fe3+-hydroxamate transport system substrate-binding protein